MAPENQVLGVIFCVDFDFLIKICGFWRPGVKIKRFDLDIFSKIRSPFFVFFLLTDQPVKFSRRLPDQAHLRQKGVSPGFCRELWPASSFEQNMQCTVLRGQKITR